MIEAGQPAPDVVLPRDGGGEAVVRVGEARLEGGQSGVEGIEAPIPCANTVTGSPRPALTTSRAPDGPSMNSAATAGHHGP